MEKKYRYTRFDPYPIYTPILTFPLGGGRDRRLLLTPILAFPLRGGRDRLVGYGSRLKVIVAFSARIRGHGPLLQVG
jgi:hypothetical protein